MVLVSSAFMFCNRILNQKTVATESQREFQYRVSKQHNCSGVYPKFASKIEFRCFGVMLLQ